MHEAILALLDVEPRGWVGRAAHWLGPATLRGAGTIGRMLMARDLRRHYPAQAERVRGIAAGAKLPEANLFVGPMVELILNKVSYVTPGACTAVAITGGRSQGGEPIIAKNFDYPEGATPTYISRTSRPSAGFASIDVTATPLPGCHEGVNEHGLAVTYNYGYFAGKPEARVPITNLVQELLETCRSVDEAIAALRSRPRTGGALLMLADAGGAVASVEAAPDHIGVRVASDHGDWLAHANHAVTPEIVPRDIPHDAVTSKWYPKVMRGLEVQASSLRRHARAEELLESGGSLSESELIAVISDHDGGAGDDTTICRHGPFYSTSCSVVLFPRRRAIKLMFGAPCRDSFTELMLEG